MKQNQTVKRVISISGMGLAIGSIGILLSVLLADPSVQHGISNNCFMVGVVMTIIAVITATRTLTYRGDHVTNVDMEAEKYDNYSRWTYNKTFTEVNPLGAAIGVAAVVNLLATVLFSAIA